MPSDDLKVVIFRAVYFNSNLNRKVTSVDICCAGENRAGGEARGDEFDFCWLPLPHFLIISAVDHFLSFHFFTYVGTQVVLRNEVAYQWI